MSAEIRLQIGDREITEVLSFRADSDLFQAADAFEATFAAGFKGLAPGLPVKLYVNKRLEFTGVLDAVERSLDKNGVNITVRGRDLMGLLVDSCVEVFADLPADETLVVLATRLLATVPFINRKAVSVAGAVPAAASVRIEPGQSIFEVLKSAANAQGLLFYSLPDGSFVFGRPVNTGATEFDLYVSKSNGSNVLSGSAIWDISQQYSKISVLSAQDGDSALAVAEDPSMPFYKPQVTRAPGQEDEAAALKFAQMALENGRLAGWRLTYTVPGFGQHGKNYTPNTLCMINDEALQVDGPCLLFGRTFVLDRQQGATTELRLATPPEARA